MHLSKGILLVDEFRPHQQYANRIDWEGSWLTCTPTTATSFFLGGASCCSAGSAVVCAALSQPSFGWRSSKGDTGRLVSALRPSRARRSLEAPFGPAKVSRKTSTALQQSPSPHTRGPDIIVFLSTYSTCPSWVRYHSVVDRCRRKRLVVVWLMASDAERPRNLKGDGELSILSRLRVCSTLLVPTLARACKANSALKRHLTLGAISKVAVCFSSRYGAWPLRFP